MVCIFCNSDTDVTNSRLVTQQNHIWRRRRCQNCKKVFTTSESIDLERCLKVSHQTRLEPFSRDKLFLSLNHSLMHRKTATSDATAITSTVIGRLYPLITAGKLNSTDIIKTTLPILKRFDKPAYTLYAAYHPLDLVDSRS